MRAQWRGPGPDRTPQLELAPYALLEVELALHALHGGQYDAVQLAEVGVGHCGGDVFQAASGFRQAIFYVVAGLGWVLPAMPIVSWMLKRDPEPTT